MTTRPKTGEKRKTQQPLKIDLLGPDVRDDILALRETGSTWEDIEERSAKPYSEKWVEDGGGFIQWETFPLAVLNKFPLMRLPASSLQRWHDIRIRQVRQQVSRESAAAQVFAESFAAKNMQDAGSAVVNAMRDQVFSLMQTVGEKDRLKFIDGLNKWTLASSRMMRVELQERRVDVDSRRVKLLEEREARARQAVDDSTKAAAKKGTGQFSLEDINLLRERTFGLPPIEAPAHA